MSVRSSADPFEGQRDRVRFVLPGENRPLRPKIVNKQNLTKYRRTT